MLKSTMLDAKADAHVLLPFGEPFVDKSAHSSVDNQTDPDYYTFLYEDLLPLRQEIVSVSKKLWARQYVDGNAGNVSIRVNEQFLLCTPTMMSKGDVEADDLCLLDMEGHHCFGTRRATSEILLHLAIYSANSAAQAVVHCHPPNATAYAVTGTIPPTGVLAEADLFIGPIAMSPYETPGTRSFAETIVPFIRNHNCVILANHGVVCWADTATHAEWCVEVLDGYCHTLILAAHLGRPLVHIPSEKILDLLEIKKRMGLPDARLATYDQPKAGCRWNFPALRTSS